MSDRIAFHTDESHEDSSGFWVIAVQENVDGYHRLNVWPTLAAAQSHVDESNAKNNISDDDRRAILASSIRASHT